MVYYNNQLVSVVQVLIKKKKEKSIICSLITDDLIEAQNIKVNSLRILNLVLNIVSYFLNFDYLPFERGKAF